MIKIQSILNIIVFDLLANIVVFQLQQNCVALRMYKGHIGKWADVDCDQTFMSLCQAKQGKTTMNSVVRKIGRQTTVDMQLNFLVKICNMYQSYDSQ